mmetsp:Transcript_30702/g.75321  ORF Transcript_30702/g.75321 Transcript_30702/m.75321 type:complete len:211 (+) Transcript_30702:736-1368(+)
MTSGPLVEDLELGKSRAELAYGEHRFTMVWVSEKGVIRISLQVDSTQVVVPKIRDQIREVLDECMKHLDCGVAVPSDGGADSGGYASMDDMAPLVMLDGATGLLNSIKNNKEMSLAKGQRLNAQELQKRFGKWTPPRGFTDGEMFDVFISYRWGKRDSDLAETMFVQLSSQLVEKRAVKVFRDRERLQDGRNFKDDFFFIFFSFQTDKVI